MINSVFYLIHLNYFLRHNVRTASHFHDVISVEAENIAIRFLFKLFEGFKKNSSNSVCSHVFSFRRLV